MDRNITSVKKSCQIIMKWLIAGLMSTLLFACEAETIKSSADTTVQLPDSNTGDTETDTAQHVNTDSNDTTATGTELVDTYGAIDASSLVCQVTDGSASDYLQTIGCYEDFASVAAMPLDSSLPGALSVKTVIDRVDDDALYFQNSDTYQVHYDFASTHLSGADGLPLILDQASFADNYYTVQRRFFLGAVTYYEGPQIWTYEISPYDNADASMIAEAYHKIASSAYFGNELYFHPTGQAVEEVAKSLPASVKTVTTSELYEGTDYQPLNVAKSCGRLIFVSADEMENGTYVGFQDIVVMDSAPNDISVVQGIITEEFQTPLSHVNVLSQNRGTPNMGLHGAWDNAELRALESKWVSLDVGPFEYGITEITAEEATACAVTPEPIEIGMMDLSVTDLADVQTIVNPALETPLVDQISAAIPAFGGKGSHFAALSWVPEANTPKAFVIPVFYYNQFMEENGFNALMDEYLADETFMTDPAVRDQTLEALRDAMMVAPINADFLATLKDKLNTEFPGIRMRFRSSTNAEDLGDFTGAGLYTSKSGDPNDPERSVEDALREVWGSIWYFRAFEERTYRGIDHKKVGMALLVHHSFPDEEANGVAVTANPFDLSGMEPGFYINVQEGEESVVQPEGGATTDQFIYYFDMQGQPQVFIEHSSLVPEGETVLTPTETYQLGVALSAIHQFFYPSYGPQATGKDWYAMDVEFKFDQGDGSDAPVLQVKQARPYPGR